MAIESSKPVPTDKITSASHSSCTAIQTAHGRRAGVTVDRHSGGQEGVRFTIGYREIANFGSAVAAYAISAYIFIGNCMDPYRHMVAGLIFGTAILIGAYRTWACPCPFDTND
ncbi:unnamed protein product, partial [Cyprideis torosa]